LSAKTLLIGQGECARRIARDLASEQADIIVATPGDDFDLPGAKAAVLPKSRVLACRGTAGDFTVALDCAGELQSADVQRIVIAESDRRLPEFSRYGLTPSETVIDISGLSARLQEAAEDAARFDGIQAAVFVCGLNAESNPVMAAEVMRAAFQLQAGHDLKTYILTGNLKVAAEGLEKLYRESRAAGVVYIKFTHTRPEIEQQDDGRVRFEFTDEITGSACRLTADLTIVDERIVPSEYTRDLARIFELESDLNGFAQGDNVHRLTVLTNRRGIVVAGGSRNVLAPADQYVDAHNAVLSILDAPPDSSAAVEAKAQIDTGRCVRCLTCYRLCPYRAIEIQAGHRIAVVAEACERCGICVAECPREAISFGVPEAEADSTPSAGGQMPSAQGAFIPTITAFCCSRSAARAGQLATSMGHRLPAGLQIVEVTCGGSVALQDILSAFQSGADGVLVLTCHEGNCHSERGNTHARQRVDLISGLMEAMGLEGGRLAKHTLASNMGVEFADKLVHFEKQLQELGPSRLKARQHN